MRRIFPLLIACTACLIIACSESDCPLVTTSYAHFDLLDSKTHAALTLTGDVVVTGHVRTDVTKEEIQPDGSIKEILVKDSLLTDTLYNKPEGSLSLPLSYTNKTTYVIHYNELLRDTIELAHKNTPFLSDIECGAMVFYQVEEVRYTTNCLDSIVIINPDINNEEKQNFNIYYTTNLAE